MQDPISESAMPRREDSSSAGGLGQRRAKEVEGGAKEGGGEGRRAGGQLVLVPANGRLEDLLGFRAFS